MNRLNRITFGTLAAMLLTMCAEHTPDLSDVAILVTPGADTPVTLSSGDKAQYSLEISTIHDYVASLKITSFDRQHGETVCLDADFNKHNFTYTFTYTAPEIDRETLEVTLRFNVTDNLGNRAEATRTVTIKNKMLSLQEKTGIVLYAPASGMPDALSLADVSQPFVLADSPFPESADIYLDADTDFSPITWRSNTQAKFIRNNTFNYVEATAASINSVYRSSVREDKITDIRINDIIIVGHGDDADGVFQVKNIIRNSHTPDCIQMNYKGISR